ncbi:MAG: hypothetical protein OXF01_09345 [Gemmatimonadetes bacterium]|nr:hypothetical protein [Gemmatimonadota bacterium]
MPPAPARLLSAILASTLPALTGNLAAAQDSVVVADNPDRPATVLRLADVAVFLIGAADGPDEYRFHDIRGAQRMPDGGVAVMVAGEYEVRRFGPRGQHLWSRGERGEGRGQFRSFPKLLRACGSDDSVVVYDIYLHRITVFNADGEITGSHGLSLDGSSPYSMTCAPNGRYVLSNWGDVPEDSLGPHRWNVSLAFRDRNNLRPVWIREGVPGSDRVFSGTLGESGSDYPRTWGRRVVFAATDEGVWMATGDDYSVEFLDWTGNTRKRVRWHGRSVGITVAHVDALYDQRLAAAGSADHRFERRWRFERGNLPDRFPTISSLLLADDGHLWVEHYPRPGESREWYVFDPDGRLVRAVEVPAGAEVQDAGADWVVLSITDDLGAERVGLYELLTREVP